MNNLVLIQARCGSTRLPNKVLKLLCGKPVLQWVIERVKRSKLTDEVIVITSIEKNNLPLIRLCTELDVRVFVGAENDVLDRYYQAARLFKPKFVVRITADCPLFDWRYLDMALEQLDKDTDYLSDFIESFPDGLDLEVISFSALENAWRKANLSSEREHVTQYIRKHSEVFKQQSFSCPISGLGDKRWTLDEDEDYELISKIYSNFINIEKREDFITEDILEFLHKHKELELINAKYGRNEGLAKSIAKDRVIKGEEE